MISEVPDPLAGDDEQRPLRLHTPARTYSWADWPDLVADLECSEKIRGLILAVTMEEKVKTCFVRKPSPPRSKPA